MWVVGLEPTSLSALEPKSRAFTNFAIPTCSTLYLRSFLIVSFFVLLTFCIISHFKDIVNTLFAFFFIFFESRQIGIEPIIPKLVECGHNALPIKLLPHSVGREIRTSHLR